MRVLVIGGTGFVGPHVLRQLADPGHDVTVERRGRGSPGRLGSGAVPAPLDFTRDRIREERRYRDTVEERQALERTVAWELGN